MLDSSANVSRRVWQVGALCQAAADALDARFNPVTVVGELSGFTRAASGHCYFSIKDEQSQLRCAMFRRAASLLNFAPRDGDQVELRGRLGVYEPRGDLQLVVESLSKAGVGLLLERFLALKAKLEAEGLFDSGRKRSIPALPRAIGVVTSLGAAALHDVATALGRRAPHVPVVIAPALVQGTGAAADVVRALQSLFALARSARHDVPAPELILLVRGGGSLEDLWTFNEEAVVRCIASSPVPVISGVGHETDFTLADFAADLRAPTPTAAAELACVALVEQLQTLGTLEDRSQASLRRTLERAAQRLDVAATRLGRPQGLLARANGTCAQLQLRLQSQTRHSLAGAGQYLDQAGRVWRDALRGRVQHEAHALERLSLRLSALDPALVLQRGYAWLTDEAGHPVTRAGATRAGQRLVASLADGRVDLRVTGTPGE